jgi:xanthine dehydrogenase YagT iron-sulfur-binding subunit
MQVSLTVNREARSVEAEPRRTLLELLRDDLGLTGTKKACDMGNCGACTVLVDGRAAYACLSLAVDCAGREVTTIEGLGEGAQLDPLQQAFIAADAFQCGFCTPGQIMSAVAMVDDEGPARSDDEIRERMSGNICRCSAYPRIVDAIRDAQQVMR